MKDRELLLLAAKALGWPDPEIDDDGMLWDGEHAVSMWNPLQDDGDCARFEAACGIALIWAEDHVVAMHPRLFKSVVVYFHDYYGDKNASRRYASTLAAAEIQRSKELREQIAEKFASVGETIVKTDLGG